LVSSSDKPVAHINVFGSSDYTDVAPVGGGEAGKTTPTLDEFYDWVLAQAKRDKDLVCQFNHPTYGNSHFDSFAVPPTKSDLVNYFALFELGSGPTGTYHGPADSEYLFRKALRAGWRVAPTIGIDNFGSLKKHGGRQRHTAILVSPSSSGKVTQQAVLDALLQRRTYASEDEDFKLECWARSPQGKAFMGGMLPTADGETVKLQLWAQSATPSLVFGSRDAVGNVYLVTVRSRRTEDSEERFGHASGSISEFSYSDGHTIHVRPDDICYYVKIIQPDGDWVVSAPIWIARSQNAPAGGGVTTSTVFVMDCSGSMSTNTPDGKQKLAAAREAAEHYLDLIDFDARDLGAKHQVGIIAFSDTVASTLPFTAKVGEARSMLSALSPMSSTNFGAAIDATISWFEKLPDEQRKGRKFVIFLSDGMTNTGPVSRDEFLVNDPDSFSNPTRLYQRARDQGIRIYTVGFGDPSKLGNFLFSTDEGLDEEVLHRIAEVPQTGGKYFAARDAFELDEQYTRSFHDSTGKIVFQATGTISQGESKQVGPFNPAAPQMQKTAAHRPRWRLTIPVFSTPAYADNKPEGQMLVTLGWSAGKLGLELKDPSGRVVDESYPGAHVKRGEQPICIAIDSPQVGSWSATITGDSVPGGQSRFNLIASARVPSSTGGGAFGAEETGTDPAILLMAIVTGGVLVLGGAYAGVVRRRVRSDSAKAPVLAWLQVHEPGFAPRNVAMYQSAVRIGRDGSNDVVLADPRASAHHAEVRVGTGAAEVLDLGSSNGTWVNGQRTDRREIENGESFRLGDTIIYYFPGSV
jgi:hypothetical protein